MSNPASDPLPPTESELAAASRTVLAPRRSAGGVHDRLTAASMLLRSLDRRPVEASLVFARGNGERIEVVAIGEGITVGRGNACTVYLGECADLSRKHFGVRPMSGAWLLEDLASRNGTMVDGVDGRITRRLLRDGDIIFAGDLLFLFIGDLIDNNFARA